MSAERVRLCHFAFRYAFVLWVFGAFFVRHVERKIARTYKRCAHSAVATDLDADTGSALSRFDLDIGNAGTRDLVEDTGGAEFDELSRKKDRCPP